MGSREKDISGHKNQSESRSDIGGPILLFVYGRFKKGFGNNYYLRRSELIGKFNTTNNYSLYAYGLPALIEKKGFGAIGELYLVNQRELARIDQIENHLKWYERREIELLGCHIMKPVYSYIYTGDTSEFDSYPGIKEY